MEGLSAFPLFLVHLRLCSVMAEGNLAPQPHCAGFSPRVPLIHLTDLRLQLKLKFSVKSEDSACSQLPFCCDGTATAVPEGPGTGWQPCNSLAACDAHLLCIQNSEEGRAQEGNKC